MTVSEPLGFVGFPFDIIVLLTDNNKILSHTKLTFGQMSISVSVFLMMQSCMCESVSPYNGGLVSTQFILILTKLNEKCM